MSTHNLCFGAKIRKIGIPLHTPVLLYESGVQWGIARTCFRDDLQPKKKQTKKKKKQHIITAPTFVTDDDTPISISQIHSFHSYIRTRVNP